MMRLFQLAFNWVHMISFYFIISTPYISWLPVVKRNMNLEPHSSPKDQQLFYEWECKTPNAPSTSFLVPSWYTVNNLSFGWGLLTGIGWLSGHSVKFPIHQSYTILLNWWIVRLCFYSALTDYPVGQWVYMVVLLDVWKTCLFGLERESLTNCPLVETDSPSGHVVILGSRDYPSACCSDPRDFFGYVLCVANYSL